jgi:hypothetical protein
MAAHGDGLSLSARTTMPPLTRATVSAPVKSVIVIMVLLEDE